MYSILNAYEQVRSGASLTDEQLEAILRQGDVKPFQLASLALQLSSRAMNRAEQNFLARVTAKIPPLADYLNAANDVTRAGPERGFYTGILRKTRNRELIGPQPIQQVIKQLLADELDLNFLACWFMLINLHGLLAEDVNALTLAMRDSGKIYDYRNSEALNHAVALRRYPTGAVSEKISLIMPSLMAAIAKEYKVVSPFLVGRALSFTGGTWDKYKAIPGFEFPLPGDETVQAMRACSIAMTVTLGDFNPADKALYQFRSLTGTVPSVELIVASIGSKMLACPADHLLMDIRYGAGAFMPTQEKAIELGEQLQTILNNNGAPCSYMTVDTAQPTGCSVGHCFEVAEAIAVMNGNVDGFWANDALQQQKELVLSFFAKLMQTQFPEKGEEHWLALGNELLRSGVVFEHFIQLLQAHQVSAEVVEQIKTNPNQLLLPNVEPIAVVSTASGKLSHIEQKQLGNLVNFGFGAGANDFGGEFSASSGIILKQQPGQAVKKGELLCVAYVDRDIGAEQRASIQNELATCFNVA